MKINFECVFKNQEDVLIEEKPGVPLTLKLVLFNALLIHKNEESPDTKFKRWEYYKNIKDGMVDFKHEDISFFKKIIGESYSALIMGQAWDFLEECNK